MVDYTELLRSDLAEQFKGKPVIDALIEAVGNQLNDVRLFYEALKTQRNIADAVGKQLDGIGDIAVLSRAEAGVLACLNQSTFVLTDDIYRSFLYYKIWKNTNNCTYRDIIKSLRMFWDLPIYYSEDIEQPATMILDAGELTANINTLPLLQAPLLRAAGVTIVLRATIVTGHEPPVLHMGFNQGIFVTTPVPEQPDDLSAQDTVRIGGGAGSSTTVLPVPESSDDLSVQSVTHTGGAIAFNARLPQMQEQG